MEYVRLGLAGGLLFYLLTMKNLILVGLLVWSFGALALDPYAVLGVESNASREVIRAAWQALVKKHMPGANAGSPEDLARMKDANAAWNMLKTDSARAQAEMNSSRERRASSAPDPTASNLESVLAAHPEWREFLSDYAAGISVLIARGDFDTLLAIYRELNDQQFNDQLARAVGAMEFSYQQVIFISSLFQIEKRWSPEGRRWDLDAFGRHLFSGAHSVQLGRAMLPIYLARADRYALRGLLAGAFSQAHSTAWGSEHLRTILMLTKREEDKGTYMWLVDHVFMKPHGSSFDPEIMVQLVMNDNNLSYRMLAWHYRAEWGARVMRAIILRGDSDALRGVQSSLAKPEFAGREWDMYREAMASSDAAAYLENALGVFEAKPIIRPAGSCVDLMI